MSGGCRTVCRCSETAGKTEGFHRGAASLFENLSAFVKGGASGEDIVDEQHRCPGYRLLRGEAEGSPQVLSSCPAGKLRLGSSVAVALKDERGYATTIRPREQGSGQEKSLVIPPFAEAGGMEGDRQDEIRDCEFTENSRAFNQAGHGAQDIELPAKFEVVYHAIHRRGVQER